MTYPQTIDYLYSKLPMFTRIGEAAIKKDLHNTLIMCEALENPQKKFKTIHIAGTNGKGSTSHMLAAILQKAGFKTALYTSPHLKDFRERIRINGKMVPKSTVIAFVKNQKSLIEKIEPSFFEVTVAMAFDYFATEEVDVAIIEVGLGGRLDSTNVIDPDLSIITNISLDHTNLLGNTLTEIAREKAGIIKDNKPVVIGELQEEIEQIFTQKAEEKNAPLVFASSNLSVKNERRKGNHLVIDVYLLGNLILPNLKLDLTGNYQLKNVLTVIHSVLQLWQLDYDISEDAIYEGLKNVKKTTGLQGRWQILTKHPLTVCDTGHNKAGITEVLKNIASSSFENLHMVIGMVADKDVSGALELLPKDATYYFCQPNLERALPAKDLAAQASNHQLKGTSYNSVQDAFEEAKRSATGKDMIFIGGSTFVVAEVL